MEAALHNVWMYQDAGVGGGVLGKQELKRQALLMVDGKAEPKGKYKVF